MQHLFTEVGLEALKNLVHRESQHKTVYAFDFDGTLAPISAYPQDVRMEPSMHHSLRLIADHAIISVISGRSYEDLKSKVNLADVILVGNHGVELHASTVDAALLREVDGWVQQLRTSREFNDLVQAGVFLEDKKLSLSLHYRNTPDPAEAKRRLADCIRGLAPLPRVVAGKYVFNVVAPRSPHKGHALRTILQRIGSEVALYAGDDVTDEDVFAMEDWQGLRVLTVRVGHDPNSKAMFYVDDESQVQEMLEKILEFRLEHL